MADRILVEKVFKAGKDPALGNELQAAFDRLSQIVGDNSGHPDSDVADRMFDIEKLLDDVALLIDEVG